jgi:hypothetical protein
MQSMSAAASKVGWHLRLASAAVLLLQRVTEVYHQLQHEVQNPLLPAARASDLVLHMLQLQVSVLDADLARLKASKWALKAAAAGLVFLQRCCSDMSSKLSCKLLLGLCC